MPNVFTRVPDRPVPPLPGWAGGVLRVADLFMVAMYSRPPSGTLATTWVTPSTLQLAAGLAVVDVVLGLALLLTRPWGAVSVLLGLLLLLIAVGAGSVALVGGLQRRG